MKKTVLQRVSPQRQRTEFKSANRGDLLLSHGTFSPIKPAVKVNNFQKGYGEKPLLSETFFLPRVSHFDQEASTTIASSSSGKKNSSGLLDLIEFTKISHPPRNLSAVQSRSDKHKVIGDVTVRSMHLDDSSQGSRRVIQIAKMPST